jgi:hypothetical protein
MPKWQYLYTTEPDDNIASRLGTLGAEGWELVAAQPVWVHEFYRDSYGDIDFRKPPLVIMTDWKCIFKREVQHA